MTAIVWPQTIISVLRAKHMSTYRIKPITRGYLIYLFVVGAYYLSVNVFSMESVVLLALALLLAKLGLLITLKVS